MNCLSQEKKNYFLPFLPFFLEEPLAEDIDWPEVVAEVFELPTSPPPFPSFSIPLEAAGEWLGGNCCGLIFWISGNDDATLLINSLPK